MKIRGIDMTKIEHDLVLSQLRKKNVGTEDKPIMEDDLTIDQWLEAVDASKLNTKDTWALKVKACENRLKMNLELGQG